MLSWLTVFRHHPHPLPYACSTSYRLCMKDGSGSEATETCYQVRAALLNGLIVICLTFLCFLFFFFFFLFFLFCFSIAFAFQKTPLKFATETTTIRYHDGSRPDFLINATTTSEGTWPVGSEWRKNPIPMCNCDIGEGCYNIAAGATQVPHKLSAHAMRMVLGAGAGKKCREVTDEAQCGTKIGVNTCLKCGNASSYDCEECCPGLTRHQQVVSGHNYTWCQSGKGPAGKCDPKKDPRSCYSQAYKTTHLRPGQKLDRCSTGLMFPAQWDDGYR